MSAADRQDPPNPALEGSQGVLDGGDSSLTDFVDRHFGGGVEQTLSLFEGPARSIPELPSTPVDALWDWAFPFEAEFGIRQRQAYVFDTLALRLLRAKGLGVLTPSAFEPLVQGSGKSDYFAAYCEARGLEGAAIVELAYRLLATTDAEYRSGCSEFFPGGPTEATEEGLSERLAEATALMSENYSTQRIIQDLHRNLTEVGLEGDISVFVGSKTGLTTNVTRLQPRHAHIFLDEGVGLEAYRGALHALGHAVFAVHPNTGSESLLGVNISATEVGAFQAQHFALDGVDKAASGFISFLHLYHARLYAVRVVVEQQRYASLMPVEDAYADLTTRYLGFPQLVELRADSKLVSVDFLLAFAAYFNIGQLDSDWQNLFDVLGAVSTRSIAETFGCLSLTIDPSLS